MINTIILGHALNVLPKLPAESVNCCVTSPPYWNLRDYSAEGQLGLEKTFEEYITKLCNIFDEVKRVLRKDGTCFVNMGDSYAGSGKGIGTDRNKCKESYSDNDIKKTDWQNISIPAKSLCDIPYRFSIEMTNRGWIKRNTIIWWKPNCMPSSADDRFTVDFEYLFFFTKNNKAIFWTNKKTLECVSKQPPGIKGIEGKDWEWREKEVWDETNATSKWSEMKGYLGYSERIHDKKSKIIKKKKVSLWTGHDYWFEQQFEELNYDSFRETKRGFNQPKGNRQEGIDNWKLNPQGRNKRCVWIIPTQSFPEAHFAVYPEGLIEIPIKAGCPEFICKKCGKARVKIYRKEIGYQGKPDVDEKRVKGGVLKGGGKQTTSRPLTEIYKQAMSTKRFFVDYTDCGCNAGWESGIVLDPFIGSGTTAREALKQRKRFIGIEIKQEYIDMSYRKIAKVQQRIF